MRALASLLAIALLAACSQMPTTASNQSRPVEHPDVFHSYID